jgi:hypothetical protein
VAKKDPRKEVFIYPRGDYEAMRQELESTNWTTLTQCNNDVNKIYEIVTEKILSLQSRYVPKKEVRTDKPKLAPGITAEDAKHIKKKHRSWQRFMETRDDKKHREYTRARNKVKAITRKAKRRHEEEIARNAKANPRRFWRHATASSKNKERIPSLYKNGKNEEDGLTSTDTEKAEVLATAFASVFTTENPEDQDITPLTGEHIPRIATTEAEVEQLLSSTNPNKAMGPDLIHPRMLKELAKPLAKPLTILFNTSLETGEVPTVWKEAFITAHPKKGRKQEPLNYRPISLTSIVCKVLESIIRSRIVDHMDTHHLLSPNQFGFVKGRSTTLQLTLLLDELTSQLENGLSVDVCYMDFQKAFDSVPHRRLIKKTQSLGIDDPLLKWIKSFLTGRTQTVVVSGEKSSPRQVESGVPQGSILGPLLFVIYVNDLPQAITSRAQLYADDTKIYRTISSPQDQNTLQEDLTKLCEWARKWQLRFHPDKCAVMTIGPHRVPPKEYILNLENGAAVMKRTTKEKDLGIIWKESLSFTEEIAERAAKANKVMGIIRRSFTYLTPTNFTLLFKALVRPHLEYGSTVWSPSLKKDVKTIEDVQRRATRQVPELKGLTYSERLKKLRLPTLAFRRLRGDMIDVYKITHGLLRVDPETILPPNRHRNTRGHDLQLEKRRVTTALRQHTFAHRVINVWNALPAHVATAPTVNAFKNRLDDHWKSLPLRYDWEDAQMPSHHAH